MEFLISIISGVASTAVIALVSWFYAKKYRKNLMSMWGKFSGTGIEYVYKNDDEANSDMVKFTRRSEKVKLLSMRAFRLLNDKASLSFLLREDSPVHEVRVLLANPDSLAVSKRADEFIYIDSSYTKERYIDDIRWSTNQVAKNQRNKRLKLKLHDEPAFIRLLITDDYLFLSFFLKDVHGDQSCVYRINRQSNIYESLNRYHDWIWEHRSKEINTTTINK